jgi:hypothetical protein
MYGPVTDVVSLRVESGDLDDQIKRLVPTRRQKFAHNGELAMSKKKTIFKAASKTKATAEHYREDDHEYVKIGALSVLVTQDGDWWFAQGLEIEYAAQGKSLEEVTENFGQGLATTAHAYLEEFGSIEKMLRPSPPEVLRELSNASRRKMLKLSVESKHEIHKLLEEPAIRQAFPFNSIKFFQRIGTGELATA